MKKIALMLLMVLLVAFGAAPAFAQFDMDQETFDILAQEPPLTQDDIDKFIKYFEAIDSVQSHAELDAILQKADVTAERMAYIYLKIGLVWQEKEEPGSLAVFQQNYSGLAPSKAEWTLIEQNMDKIEALDEE